MSRWKCQMASTTCLNLNYHKNWGWLLWLITVISLTHVGFCTSSTTNTYSNTCMLINVLLVCVYWKIKVKVKVIFLKWIFQWISMYFGRLCTCGPTEAIKDLWLVCFVWIHFASAQLHKHLSQPSSSVQISSSSSSSSTLPWFSFSLFPHSIRHSLHVSVHQLPKPCSTSFTHHHASVQRLSFTAVYNKLRSSSGEAAGCSLAVWCTVFCTVIPGFERARVKQLKVCSWHVLPALLTAWNMICWRRMTSQTSGRKKKSLFVCAVKSVYNGYYLYLLLVCGSLCSSFVNCLLACVISCC